MVNYVFLSVYFYSVPNLRFNGYTENWQKYRTIELGQMQRGKSKHRPRDDEKLYGGAYPFIQTGDIKKANLYIKEYERTYSNYGLSQSKLWSKGTLCITIAANIAETAILGLNACFPDSVIGWISNEKITNNIFIKYYFDFYKTQLKRLSVGGAQENLNLDKLENVYFHIPTLPEQNDITNLLTKIDELIETQIKIIDDYNSLKMGIYNCMFKENYADYKLKQLAYIVKGDQINNDQLLSNGSYYMMNGGASPSGYLDSYNVSENTISISEGGNSCGYVQFNSSPFWSGGHCYTIQNVNSALIENKYLYHYLKYKEKEIMNLRIGTGLPNIQKKDLENFTILVPSLLIQRKNLALFEMLDEKISILNEELANLQKQKKYLLCNMFI